MRETEILTPENFLQKGPKKSVIEQSGSLRRRSLLINANAINANETINDDDAERSELVASERPVTSTPTTNSSPRSRANDTPSSISSPQKEHFQGCLKLYAENKITKDNAWNLQLIDFMTSMIRRHDKRMENLQVASAVVDASTRIYSLRVDGVYHDVLKMAGGLVKASNAKRGKRDDDADPCDDQLPETQGPSGVKKKRKKMRGAIADPNSLNGDADLNENIDPFLERLAAQSGDVTSSNRAFNATLPIDPKTNCLVISTEDPFLEQIAEEMNEDLELIDHIMLRFSMLPEYKEKDEICEPFTGFSISNWNPDHETNDRVNSWVEENRLNLSQQAMAFDLNADVEPIPLEDDRNFDNLIGDDEPLAGMDSDEETEMCAVAAQRIAARPAPALTLCATPQPLLASLDRRLEYSYCAAWAGPAHWRPRGSKMSSDAGSIRGVESVRGQSTAKPRKGALDFASLTTGPPVPMTPAPPHKICISRKTLAYSHAWNEANFKRPIDRGLSESHLCRLFLKKSSSIQRKPVEQQQEPAAEPEHAADYDYNNEHDQSYCVSSQHIMEDNGEDIWEEAGAITRTSTEAADGQFTMVEPPAKVAKIFIPYAMRAKHIDMKLLKNTSWKILTSPSGDASRPTVEKTSFNCLLTRLPDHLPPASRESLSLPLSLLSVLHLANERGLKIKKHEDHKDFSIEGILEVD